MIKAVRSFICFGVYCLAYVPIIFRYKKAECDRNQPQTLSGIRTLLFESVDPILGSLYKPLRGDSYVKSEEEREVGQKGTNNNKVVRTQPKKRIVPNILPELSTSESDRSAIFDIADHSNAITSSPKIILSARPNNLGKRTVIEAVDQSWGKRYLSYSNY